MGALCLMAARRSLISESVVAIWKILATPAAKIAKITMLTTPLSPPMKSIDTVSSWAWIDRLGCRGTLVRVTACTRTLHPRSQHD